jgi:hypothetical protein
MQAEIYIDIDDDEDTSLKWMVRSDKTSGVSLIILISVMLTIINSQSNFKMLKSIGRRRRKELKRAASEHLRKKYPQIYARPLPCGC